MSTQIGGDYYRASDGVRITHDPYAPGMAEKYGAPGNTDSEGFDPYGDSVGAGIYGGIVKRDSTGNIVMGRQYQNHNPRKGPVYAGGGYAPVSEALKDVKEKLTPLLAKYPDLANDVTTGGASPLHMCGMGKPSEGATAQVIKHGGDIEALDTYGMTALHRMASNNLPVGAQALIDAGADPLNQGQTGATPHDVARESRANEVIAVLNSVKKRKNVGIARVFVEGVTGKHAGVNGNYIRRPGAEIPDAFAAVCAANGWNVKDTWKQLNNGNDWLKHESHHGYMYFNVSDKKWWIDGSDGLGAFTNARSGVPTPHAVPAHGWETLGAEGGETEKLPIVHTFRESDSSRKEL